MTRKHFGTDGVRGRANDLLTPDLAMRVGQAAGVLFRSSAVNRRVVIGKDTRISGYMIETALVAGFTSIGMDVLQLGPMPSPGCRHAHSRHARRSRRDDFCVTQPFRGQRHQVLRPGRLQAHRRQEHEIEAVMESFGPSMLAASSAIGRAKRIDSVRARYVEFVKRTLPRDLSLEGLRVVIDCANGAAYKVAPEALWELRRGSHRDRRRAGRLQHQPRRRLDGAGGAAPEGAGAARRHRHRARRRRRPRARGR